MRRLFVFSLLAILLALWVALYVGFPADPGYLLVAFGEYTFETSLFALLVAAAIIFSVLRLALLFVRWSNPLSLFRAGKEIAHRRRSGARSRSVEGLLHLARRNWQAAYNTLIKSAHDDDASVVNYLGAAIAAQELGEKDKWQRCLSRAEQEFPPAQSTVQSMKAQLLYRSGQLEQCLAVLELMRKTSINDLPLLQLSKTVYLQLKEWEKLAELRPQLEKHDLLSENERLLIDRQLLISRMKQMAAEVSAVPALYKLWKKSAAETRFDPGVVNAYVDVLQQLGGQEEAVKAFEQTLPEHWNAGLLRRFGEEDLGLAGRQLLIAENWLKSRPNDAELLLCLGRLAMRNRLWGKAREYFQSSTRVAPTAEAYAELSRLLDSLGDRQAGDLCRLKYGEFMDTRLPALPQPEAEPSAVNQ